MFLQPPIYWPSHYPPSLPLPPTSLPPPSPSRPFPPVVVLVHDAVPVVVIGAGL